MMNPPSYYPDIQIQAEASPLCPKQQPQQQRPCKEHNYDLFSTQDFDFASKDQLIRITNCVYRACFQFWFYFFVAVCLLVVPFIAIAAAAFEAAVAMFGRPFAKPIGKLMADIFGHSYVKQLKTPQQIV
eukprot:TRINITY_DN2008_c0_g1_i4.p2 TRINITY_DN2008_c0_g1~~TRINITY_DN2008_c0_g1_i4.p2  ORF type:complete len:129 (+),score=38.31 TRINITY_DN2008_c0_g1_i4:91-477(+)